MATPRFTEWFRYFPADYRWSAALALALGSATYGGAELGEVDAIGRSLVSKVGDDAAWFDAWTEMGERLQSEAEGAERAGHGFSAASAYLRACTYYQVGERFRLPKDKAALDAYSASLECFRRFAAFESRHGLVIERVEVAYEETSLPGYLVFPRPSAVTGPPPCVVFFDGLDITKELQFCRGVTELTRRGLACLVVDGPGNGEAIRYRGLDLIPQFERAGSAVLDHLAARDDLDASRTGVMAISLGGYYAPRCAALDHRFAACVAWGGIWDYRATWERRMARSFESAMSVRGDHISWVLGVANLEEALDRLEGFVLDGVVQQMRCPFLLLHGAEDEQVPLSDAMALFAAVGSKDKTCRVFDQASGGATHCQTDQLTAATSVFADWLADTLSRSGKAR
ncbi:MAG: alpha/beta hydrolase family protein [Acidimicrobiales bacterium]